MALKSKLFSMRMDERETATAFVARINDVKDGLGAIGETVSDSDLVSITLSGMVNFKCFLLDWWQGRKLPHLKI